MCVDEIFSADVFDDKFDDNLAIFIKLLTKNNCLFIASHAIFCPFVALYLAS